MCAQTAAASCVASIARRMRLRLLFAVAVLPLVLWAVLPLPSQAQPPQAGSTPSSKDRATQGKIGQQKGTERVLDARDRGVHAAHPRLEAQISRCSAARPTSRPTSTPSAPSSRGSRPTCATSARAWRGCGCASPRAARRSRERLVELYQADQPDLVTVVLNSEGFADLLERGEFIERIPSRTSKIIDIVRAAKADATATGAAPTSSSAPAAA